MDPANDIKLSCIIIVPFNYITFSREYNAFFQLPFNSIGKTTMTQRRDGISVKCTYDFIKAERQGDYILTSTKQQNHLLSGHCVRVSPRRRVIATDIHG